MFRINQTKTILLSSMALLVGIALLPTSASAMNSKELVQACQTHVEVMARGGRNVSQDEAFDVGFCDAAVQSFSSARFECAVVPGVDMRGFVRVARAILAERGGAFDRSNFTTITSMAFDRIPVRATSSGPRCPDQASDRPLFSQ